PRSRFVSKARIGVCAASSRGNIDAVLHKRDTTMMSETHPTTPPKPPTPSASIDTCVEEIRFAVGQTSLGAILVASSTKGIASILLGDDPDELVRNLQDRFAKARLIGADRDYESLVARIVSFVDTPGSDLNLPLDIRGTAFQRRVWQKLQEIPVGK